MLIILKMAARNILRQKRRTIITELSIIFGVVVIILLGGLIANLKDDLGGDIISTLTGHIIVHTKGYKGGGSFNAANEITDAAKAERLITREPEVLAVTTRLRFGGLIGSEESSHSFIGIGIDPDREYEVCGGLLSGGRSLSIIDGRPLASGTSYEDAILGAGLAKSLGARVGDELVLLANTKDGYMNAANVRVVGIFKHIDQVTNDMGLYVTLKNAQSLLDLGGGVSEIVVRLEDGRSIERVLVRLRKSFSDGGLDLTPRSWEDVAGLLKSGVVMFNAMFSVIALVLFLVVASAVTNTMLMAVFERTREIGTMMSVGMTRWRIVALFLLETLTIGLLGVVVGVILGVVITDAVGAVGIRFPPPPYVETDLLLHPEARLADAAMAGVLTFLIAILSALYPAYAASRMEPVEALRYV
jgi:putative ABC transport system permease protein